MKSRKRESAPEKLTGGYAALPDSVTASQPYIHLSDAAVRLLMELIRHHDGWNNGLLHTSYTALASRGLGSKSKVERAFRELLDAGFIVQTRSGGLNKGPDTYALTWLPPSRTDRRGESKVMPLLPSPYPINRFLVVKTAPRGHILRGAARRSRTASVAREIHGEDATGIVNPAGSNVPVAAATTGITVLFPPQGTVAQRKSHKLVPPQGTDYPAWRDRLSRPRELHHPAGRGWSYQRPGVDAPRLITGLINARPFGGHHVR